MEKMRQKELELQHKLEEERTRQPKPEWKMKKYMSVDSKIAQQMNKSIRGSVTENINSRANINHQTYDYNNNNHSHSHGVQHNHDHNNNYDMPQIYKQQQQHNINNNVSSERLPVIQMDNGRNNRANVGLLGQQLSQQNIIQANKIINNDSNSYMPKGKVYEDMYNNSLTNIPSSPQYSIPPQMRQQQQTRKIANTNVNNSHQQFEESIFALANSKPLNDINLLPSSIKQQEKRNNGVQKQMPIYNQENIYQSAATPKQNQYLSKQPTKNYQQQQHQSLDQQNYQMQRHDSYGQSREQHRSAGQLSNQSGLPRTQMRQYQELVMNSGNGQVKHDINDGKSSMGRREKNYIQDNMQKVIHDKKTQNSRILNSNHDQQSPQLHKSFGKVPTYINKFAKQKEDHEYQLRREEEDAKIPPGTRQMSEDERQRTLEELFESKKEVANLLEKLPIGSTTLAARRRRKDLEEKSLRIERAIETFSKKTVYIAL
eukprot:403330630